MFARQFRLLLEWSVMPMNEESTRGELHARVDALSRGRKHNAERIAELEAENDALRERLARLEMVVDPDPTGTDWDALSHDDKVFRVRQALAEKAASNGGRAAMTYAEVRAAFDYKPAVGTAYNLMDAAATADGFEYDDATGDKRITVILDDVNDDAVVQSLNNAEAANPA